jgi:hypothetical protein
MALSKHILGLAVQKSMHQAFIGLVGSASVAGGVLLAPSAAQAAFQPAINFTEAPKVINGDGIFNLGYHFTTDADRQLLGIGVYNTGAQKNHSVGIWDFSSVQSPQLVWSSSLLAADPCSSDAYYCWRAVTDGPTLKRGVDYVASAVWDARDFLPGQVDPADISYISGFQLNQPATSNLEVVLPDLLANQSNYPPIFDAFDFDKGLLAVNVSFETYTPSNVPAPLPLFGAAAAFGWSRKLRRRIGSTI